MPHFNFDIDTYKTRFLGGLRQYHFFCLLSFPRTDMTKDKTGFDSIKNQFAKDAGKWSKGATSSILSVLNVSDEALVEKTGTNIESAAGALGGFVKNGLTVFGLGAEQDKFPYYVKSTQVPSSIFQETAIEYQNFSFKMAGRREFTDWTVTFYSDEKGDILRKFYDWQELIHNSRTGEKSTTKEYMWPQEIHLLDYSGNAIVKYKLHKAWPKQIGEITLDYGAEDITTFDVTFTYQFLEMEQMPPTTVSDLIKRGANRILGQV